MSADLDLLRDALGRLLAAAVTPESTLAAEAEGIDREAWRALVEFGLAGPAVLELAPAELMEALRLAGRAAALVPLADSEAVARWLAEAAGFATDPAEILTVAICEPAAPGAVSLAGAAFPHGRHAERAVLSFACGGEAFVALVPAAALKLVPAANLAGEPRDRPGVAALAVPEARPVGPLLAPDAVLARGALCRTAAMLGAAERAEELALRYAGERVQFGSPLAKYQVIQAYLAEMAAEAAAADAAFAAALLAGEEGAVAAAKIQAGLMARRVAALAHQVHGAMGFTQEYPLHLATRRLWAWRDEYGGEAFWAERLGNEAIAAGGEGTWNRLAV